MSSKVPAEGSPTGSWTLLEENQRFSQSVLWTIQKAYYHKKGPGAWHSGEVPHYATCNAFIAQSYADVVMAYLQELRRTGVLVEDEPVYIIELAAGVGAFAALFLRKLGQLRQESSLRHLDIRYVMTDFTDANLDVWSVHPHLAPFVEAGALAFGTFDVDTDDTVELRSGTSLAPGSLKNPVVVLANYAFDTFRHDLFRVESGELHEVQVSTRAPGPGPIDLSQDGLMAKLGTRYNTRVIDEGSYYDDPACNELLSEYRSAFAELTFAVPIGGLVGTKRLFALAGDRGMLLSSDKGVTHLDELFQPGLDSRQLHTGCFSMMVNYHAIGGYFERRGGVYAATTRKLMNLKTAMCLLGGDELPDTLSMFRRRIEDFGPGEFFDYIQRKPGSEPTIPQFLGLLRMSGHDPGLLHDHTDLIRENCRNLPDHLDIELRLAIDRAWANYYANPKNLPFELGRIMLALGRPLDGVRFNQTSIELFGETPAVYLNLGLCYYYASNPDEALRCFERSKELNPDFHIPREWIARIKAERGRAAMVRSSADLSRPHRLGGGAAAEPQDQESGGDRPGNGASVGAAGQPPR